MHIHITRAARAVSRSISITIGCVAALVLASAAYAQSLSPTAPEQVGLSSDRLARIDAVLGEHIDDGKLPGAVVMIARHGKLAYAESFGARDPEAQAPMQNDAIFRIYSMTKPLVSVAAMILVEEGRMQLADPVAKILPAFADMTVSVPSTNAFGKVSYALVPAARQMTVQDLLRHTAGLAYGEITHNAPVRGGYAEAGLYQPGVINFSSRDMTPAEQVARLSKIPLVHEPGTVWEYGLSSDLLGRVVEAVSGQRLGDFLEQRLFGPLGMVDSGFSVPTADIGRVAEAFATAPATGAPIPLIDVSVTPGNDSGGAGGVSTALDYLRFSQMLLDGGALDDARILSRTSVALMASDHLDDTIEVPVSPSQLVFGSPGYGFGLGFAVRTHTGRATVPGSVGEFMWAGYAGTYFWIDPQESLVAVMMTQAPGPSRAYYRRLIRQLVYQAIID